MNNGKICVSICAKMADEFVGNIKRAEKYADVIELRFDCLSDDELTTALTNVLNNSSEKPFLITFRPAEEGGNRNLSMRERAKFWELLFAKNQTQNIYVDFEFDLKELFNFRTTKSIASFHDFSTVHDKLNWFYEVNSLVPKAQIIKIAAQTDDITDSIAVWKLIEKAKSNNQQIIPIAMGEAGKWTRILGLAYGAFMTYAALESGNETAPGQISAKDLIETYRVKELNEETEIYGIIGNPVSQSVSPFMHNAAFKVNNLNAVFIPFEVKNLDDFIRRMVRKETAEVALNFRGFSVTIPHKQAIIKHLDFIDETAQSIGAVNTVKIKDGKFYGYNTDAPGFIEPLKNTYGDLKNTNVAILGAGGAARAVIYALKKEEANVTVFARNLEKSTDLANKFKVELKSLKSKDQNLNFNDFDILINTTPLGMKGKLEGETPVVALQIENVKLVYDLVYNPFETQLIKEANKANVPTIGGMAMLVAQGMRQFKIWTELDAPMKEMSQAALRKLTK